MKVLVTSTNKAKIEAAKNICSKFFPEAFVYNISSDSMVSSTPDNDDEAIKGCFNRIKGVIEGKSEFDIYISFEGLISKNNYGTFVYGWCLVFDKSKNRYSLGASSSVMVPKYIADKLENNLELSEIVKVNYDSQYKDKQDIYGSNGLFTNGIYTRTAEFEDALTCALGYFFNENNYIDESQEDISLKTSLGVV